MGLTVVVGVETGVVGGVTDLAEVSAVPALEIALVTDAGGVEATAELIALAEELVPAAAIAALVIAVVVAAVEALDVLETVAAATAAWAIAGAEDGAAVTAAVVIAAA